jgi:hypothetical protein
VDEVRPPRLSRFQPTPKEAWRMPAALTDIVRLTLLIAGAMLVVGSVSDWIEVWLLDRGWFGVSAFQRFGDGGITLELGIVLFVFAWSERVHGSRLAAFVAAPLVIGIVCVLVLRIAFDDIQQYLDSLSPQGGKGYILPGYWLTLGGAVLATLGGFVRIWRVRREVRWSIGIDRSHVGASAGALVGAIAGFAVGAIIAQLLTSGSIGGVTGSVLVVTALVFGFAGTWLGASAGSRLAASTRRS